MFYGGLVVRKILNLGGVLPMGEPADETRLDGEMAIQEATETRFRQLANQRSLIPSLNATKEEVKLAVHEALRLPLKQSEANNDATPRLSHSDSFLVLNVILLQTEGQLLEATALTIHQRLYTVLGKVEPADSPL